jgi:hypothetical protein
MDQKPGREAKIKLLATRFGKNRNSRYRLKMLDLLVGLPGPATDAFLQKVLKDDSNAALRQRAASILGQQGAPGCALSLKNAALHDPLTLHIGGCKSKRQHARVAASAALDRLRQRQIERDARLRQLEKDTKTGQKSVAPPTQASRDSWLR